MKTVLICFVLCLCNQTFGQQIKGNDAKPPPLISLEYPNIKDYYISKNDSLSSFLEIQVKETPSLFIDTSRRANRNFAFSQPKEKNLSNELLKITHRFPGDGSNLAISPKGLLVP